MHAIEKIRIRGIVERRPSANAMPTGIDVTMPVTDTTSVIRRPPQTLVSTIGNPPRSSPITAITAPMPAKIARLTMRARHPDRMDRRLDVIAKPDQRPNQIRNGDAEQDDQLPEHLQQRSNDRRRLTEACHFAAGLADAISKSGQKPRGPANAESSQSTAVQQEKRHERKGNEEQPGIEALGRQAWNQQRQ